MYGVGVLYSRLGKTAVNSVQEGTKLASMQEDTD